MRTTKILLVALLYMTATSCEKLEQEPPNIQNADSLTEFDGPLHAAYFYQLGSVTPMAVMGDFRADNAYMDESPYDEFDNFRKDLIGMENQFFGPFYTAMYRSILSANNVIVNSEDAIEVGEAKFLRALSYFKLVQVFGDVSINTSVNPPIDDPSILSRQPVNTVYTTVIIPDLQDAISVLGTAAINGRASKLAAQSLLGKVYLHRGDFPSAEVQLADVVNGAEAAGFSLRENFSDIFGFSNDLNSEIIFATQIDKDIVDEYGFSEFWTWFNGLDTKSLNPLDPANGPTIIAAFDESPSDLRRAVTIDDDDFTCPKFPQTDGPDHDWIEIRLADVLLMYAEALNENNAPASQSLGLLDDLRTRAGVPVLDPMTINTKELVREAIAKERRLELAFEGHRWFDLVRTNTVDTAMGEAVNDDFHLFPIPTSEIFASFEVITQNPGYN